MRHVVMVVNDTHVPITVDDMRVMLVVMEVGALYAVDGRCSTLHDGTAERQCDMFEWRWRVVRGGGGGHAPYAGRARGHATHSIAVTTYSVCCRSC
jgi:hypothetical protein